jgi:hypothetical protein
MEKRGRALPKVLRMVAAISVLALWPGPSLLQAQRMMLKPAGEPADEDASSVSFPAPDRNISQALDRAQKVLKEHRYGEALEGLSQVLRVDDDFLISSDRKLSLYKGLKAKAQQLLGQMPSEGRDLYEVRNGAEARDKLNRAVASGNADGLSEVSAQWFHTQAGYDGSQRSARSGIDAEAAPRRRSCRGL